MTRDGGGKPRDKARAGRQITDEEAELWHQVGRSLDKVKKKPRVPAHGDAPVASSPDPAPGPPSGGARRGSQKASSGPTPSDTRPLTPESRRAPAPAEIDRRTLRKMAIGKVAIDAVLDLHGLTQEAAHSRLRDFLMGCRAEGLRMVLVITGKGAKSHRSDAADDDWPSGGGQRGVLRRTVPMWLDEPELRAIVVSYAAAGVRHGGEGALYIRLRRARDG